MQDSNRCREWGIFAKHRAIDRLSGQQYSRGQSNEAFKFPIRINKALETPVVREKFPEFGLDIVGGTPEQYAAHIKKESARWAGVVKRSGAKVD